VCLHARAPGIFAISAHRRILLSRPLGWRSAHTGSQHLDCNVQAVLAVGSNEKRRFVLVLALG
jgi:hypothetical protein